MPRSAGAACSTCYDATIATDNKPGALEQSTIGISENVYCGASSDSGQIGIEFLGLEMSTMKKPIGIAPILLIAVVSPTIALADRMNERASHDRFSFGDWSATAFLVN